MKSATILYVFLNLMWFCQVQSICDEYGEWEVMNMMDTGSQKQEQPLYPPDDPASRLTYSMMSVDVDKNGVNDVLFSDPYGALRWLQMPSLKVYPAVGVGGGARFLGYHQANDGNKYFVVAVPPPAHVKLVKLTIDSFVPTPLRWDVFDLVHATCHPIKHVHSVAFGRFLHGIDEEFMVVSYSAEGYDLELNGLFHLNNPTCFRMDGVVPCKQFVVRPMTDFLQGRSHSYLMCMNPLGTTATGFSARRQEYQFPLTNEPNLATFTVNFTSTSQLPSTAVVDVTQPMLASEQSVVGAGVTSAMSSSTILFEFVFNFAGTTAPLVWKQLASFTSLHPFNVEGETTKILAFGSTIVPLSTPRLFRVDEAGVWVNDFAGNSAWKLSFFQGDVKNVIVIDDTDVYFCIQDTENDLRVYKLPCVVKGDVVSALASTTVADGGQTSFSSTVTSDGVLLRTYTSSLVDVESTETTLPSPSSSSPASISSTLLSSSTNAEGVDSTQTQTPESSGLDSILVVIAVAIFVIFIVILVAFFIVRLKKRESMSQLAPPVKEEERKNDVELTNVRRTRRNTGRVGNSRSNSIAHLQRAQRSRSNTIGRRPRPVLAASPTNAYDSVPQAHGPARRSAHNYEAVHAPFGRSASRKAVNQYDSPSAPFARRSSRRSMNTYDVVKEVRPIYDSATAPFGSSATKVSRSYDALGGASATAYDAVPSQYAQMNLLPKDVSSNKL